MSKKLLVLDLNGVLIDKKYSLMKEHLDLSEGNDFFCFGDFVIFLRNGCLSLIENLSKKYTLGLWSSTHRKNVIKILEKFFENYRLYFNFVWCREKTLLDPHYDSLSTSIEKFDTIKPIEFILHDPIINENRVWNEKNVLIVDNSESKLRFNNEKNTLLIPVFDADRRETFLFPSNIEEMIENKFTEMEK